MTAFFARFGVAIHVALLVLWASWARGGSAPAYFWALPWLSLGVVDMLFLQPPRREGESPRSATRHLLRRLAVDPISYFGVLLLGFLLIQWVNGPLELEYDVIESIWRYTAPKISGMPFCVDRGEASQVLIWFTAVVAALLAVRHGTGPQAKYLLLRILVVNGALLAVLGFLQLATSPDKLFWYRPMSCFFFSTFGYPNHAGAFFVLTSAVNMGLLIRALAEEDDANHPIPLGITLILNIAAAYGSLSRAAMVLETLLVLFALAYGFAYLRGKASPGVFARVAAVAAVLAGCTVFLIARPGTDFSKEARSIDAKSLSSVYAGDRRQLAEAAIEIWKDHPWTGVGGWGFRRYVGLYMGEDQWGMLQEHGKANVHNDFAQFLCEHGAIGFGLMAALALTLLAHLAFRLALSRRGGGGGGGGGAPPTVVLSLAGCACTLVHGTIDLPFRSSAVLLSWFIVLACLPGLVRRRERS